VLVPERRSDLLRTTVQSAALAAIGWCSVVVLDGCNFDAGGLGGTGPNLGESTSTAGGTTRGGEDEPPVSSTSVDSTATSTLTSTDSGAPVTDEGSTTAVGSDSTTGMQGCLDDEDCPPLWVCEVPECINPDEGKACVGAADCGPAAPFCAYDGMCHDGSDGDPCSGDNQCAAPIVCGPSTMCQDGSEGDGCAGAGDCGATAPFCASDAQCHDGSMGDPCIGDNHCDGLLVCSPLAMCQDGSEGDPCAGDGDCGAGAPFCASDAHCHDGSDGDPCSGDNQCAAPLVCGLTNVCQDGSEGDPCAGNGDCGPLAPYCALDAQCHDGSMGDPCISDAQCAGALVCTPGFNTCGV
jgi:hypothetical protein